MISPREKAYISRNAWSTEHDYLVDSFLFGEPFLVSDTLVYFDGVYLSVSMNPIRYDVPVSFSEIVEQLNIDEPECVRIFGYQHLCQDIAQELERRYAHKQFYYESVGSSEYCATSESAELTATRAFKAGESLGYRLVSDQIDFIPRDVHFLFARGMKGECINDSAYWSLLPRLVRQKGFQLLRAYLEDRLVGFILLHRLSEYLSVAHMMNRREEYKYVLDFLIGSVVFNEGEPNQKILLGHGETAGTDQFKKKWSRAIELSPMVGFNFSNNIRMLGSEPWWLRFANSIAVRTR